jgi:hypothetical protein
LTVVGPSDFTHAAGGISGYYWRRPFVAAFRPQLTSLKVENVGMAFDPGPCGRRHTLVLSGIAQLGVRLGSVCNYSACRLDGASFAVVVTVVITLSKEVWSS